MSKFLCILLLRMVVSMPGIELVSSASFAQRATVENTAANEITVIYRTSAYNPELVYVDSVRHFYFRESELHRKAGREAALPTEYFFVGIPPSGDVVAEVIQEDLGDPMNVRLASLEELSVSDDSARTVLRKFRADRDIGLPGGFHSGARLAEVFWLRYQRVAVVEVTPFRYDSRAQTLVKRDRIAVRITFQGDRSLPAFPSLRDQHFESTYASILVNYDQAKLWRALPPSSSTIANDSADSTGLWFDPLREYVKVPVVDDGIVRITYENLFSAGVLPIGPVSSDVRLFYKGKDIPFQLSDGSDSLFGPGDALEFFGTPLRDSGLVLNEYSDTSMFWILFNQAGGLRSASDTVVVPVPDDTVRSFPVTVRMERDSFYFFGNGGILINNQSGKAPGEGWYWKKLLANQTGTVAFTSRNLFTSGNPSYEIRGRLHSPVANGPTPPNHEAEVRLNNTLIGVIQFAGLKDTLFILAAPAILFNEGENSISIVSKPTAATVNEIYLDWIEVSTQHELFADNDTLLFNAGTSQAGVVALFQLGGFSSPDISVYRIGPNGGVEKSFRGALQGTGPYSLSFTDTVTAGRNYIALTQARKSVPLSLEKKTFANLRSSSRGTDYLVITSNELVTEANRLATYRSQQGLGRAEVVLVKDIYDEFNFGHFDPFAIRRFLLAIDTLWTTPAPAFVVLFGDASWDYKDHLKGGRRNLVPSLGNPVSDAWLVSAPNDIFLPTKKVGRIPARSAAEAATFVDMLLEYETLPLSAWNKRFLFLASGFDSVETARFRNFSESLISQRITPPPVSGEVERLYKTSAVIDFEQTEDVKDVLSKGAVWMNFYGHAGTDFWGNGLSDAVQFVNQENKRHLISDISCSTVRFAEPLVESFSERLLFANAGGAIGYLGSSGFGFESPLQTIATEFYRGFAADTIRELGTLLLRAKIVLRGVGQPSIFAQFSLQQMTLLGDPATRIAVGVRPDLAVQAGGISTDPIRPAEADQTVKLVIPILNYGLHSGDSVRVLLSHSIQGDPPETIEMLRPPVGRLDTLIVERVSFKKGGLHSVTVTVDPLNEIAEESETNNSVVHTFFVGSSQVQALYPLPFSTSDPSTTFLMVQNPGIPSMSDWLVRFEIDSSATFGSLTKVSNVMSQGVVTTSWLVPPGILGGDTHYFWRARIESGSDSSDWSSSVFVTTSGQSRQWIQDRASLFDVNIFDQTEVNSGVRLQSRNKELKVFSGGYDDGINAVVWVDGTNISQGFSDRGYNVAVLNQYSGVTEFFGAFNIYSDTPDTSLAEPLIQFLNTIPVGRRVIVGIADEGLANRTERLVQAIESLGSGQIRSLTFRGSWAILGVKGAIPGSVPEGRTASMGGPVTLTDTVLFQSIQGSFTTLPFGPAKTWTDMFLEVDTSVAGTHVSLDVLRLHRNGVADTVYSVSFERDSVINLLQDSVRTVQFRLNLLSETPGLSPRLIRWWVNFEPPPELASNYQAARLDTNSILEGEVLSVEADIYNFSQTVAESVEVAIFVNANNVTTPLSPVVFPVIPGGAYETITASFPTAGSTGRVDFVFQIDPDGKLNEAFTDNNVFSLPSTVLSDTTAPLFAVTFDGVNVFDNDYVRPEPEIRIGIRDNSPLPITDPNSVVLKLDNRRITLGSTPDSLFETLTGNEKARVTFRPTLAKGNHLLSVQVLDASGNPADSMEYEVRFKVETDLRLLQVFNFPNPFSTETAFTFHLTGIGMPDEVTLRVYTTAGRMVYERRLMPGEVNIGFNRIPWDGRDQNGDAVANGVYFYKVSAVQDGKRVEVVEKLARVR